MFRNTVSNVMLILLVTSMLVLAVKIQPVRASGTITINPDGSITPSTAPIYTADNVTYTLTGDIVANETDGIVIERDNMILDGAGYTVQGAASLPLQSWYSLAGVDLAGRSNVTIENMNIDTCDYGVYLNGSSNNVMIGNNITNFVYGIYLDSSSSYNNVSGNNIGYNAYNVVGICLYSSTYNSIDGNNITNCVQVLQYGSGFGIQLDFSSNNSVGGNNVTNNEFGIYFSSSSRNMVRGNKVANNGFGIYLDSSSNNDSIVGNSFLNDGLVVWGNSYENIVVDNLVNGRPLVYLENVSNYTLYEDAGQVVLVNCNSILVENVNISCTDAGVELWGTNNTTISGSNMIANTTWGILLEYSSDNSVSENNIANNTIGIQLDYSYNNNINGNNITANRSWGVGLTASSNNSISGNSLAKNGYGIALNDYNLTSSSNNTLNGNNITRNGYGILVESCYNNTVSENNIANNQYGIYLYYSSSGNKVYHNNFVNNAQQAGVDSTNIWDDGYPSGGNYWSDYNGTDQYSGPYQNETGSDGIGDTPYSIDANNIDHYPLMNLYSPAAFYVAKTVVGQGFNVSMYFTGTIYGDYPETFNVTVYANTTLLASENVTYTSGNSVNITFTWNTTGLAYGTYNLTACAWSVANETNPGNNNFTGSLVTVSIPGDLNGDFKVSRQDLVILANAYGSKPGDSNWNPNADINGDGRVSLQDLVILAIHYGEHYP